MRNLVSFATLVLLAAPSACSPAHPAAAPTSPHDAAKPAPAQIATNPPLDLSPVAEPADIVGVLRWTNPAATLASASACSGLPAELGDAGGRMVVDTVLKELFHSSIDTKQLGAVVALDAPVHLLVALDPTAKRAKPVAALSLGLASLERAKSAIEGSASLTEAAPGMWKIGAKSHTTSSCFIAASAGSAPARLLCGDRDRDITLLGPYLTRTLPTLAAEPRDVHGELRFGPLSAKFGGLAKQQLRGLPILAQSQFSIGEPKFDRALVEAANAVQDELTALIGDADKATLDLGVDPKSCISLSESVQLRAKASWLATTMADNATRAGAAPDIFWRLPKDSETAFFGHGSDPDRYAPILKTLRSLLEGWLDKEKVGAPGDRKALADLIALPYSKNANAVSAHGQAEAAPPPAKADKLSPQAALDAQVGSLLGWTLIGVDEGPAVFIKYLSDLVAAYNRPALLGALKKQLGNEDAKHLPILKTVPAPKELGKSALAVQIDVKDLPAPDLGAAKPGANASKPVTLTLYMFLMGEDKATWVAFGADKRELLKRLAAVKSGTPDTTLASRAGVEPLKSEKMVGGGFMTIAPVVHAITSTLSVATASGSGPSPQEAQMVASLLGNLPHKGEGLILTSTQVENGSGPRGEIALNLTKPVLEDVGALILAASKLAGVLKP